MTDHIIFAYKRLKQNQIISNPFAIETKHLYSDAYAIASQVIDKLNQRLDVKFHLMKLDLLHYIASNTEDLTIHEMS